MGETGISWTDETWNPVKGCSRVSDGCVNCYAEVQAARIVRMGKGKPTAYDQLVHWVGSDKNPRWTGAVSFDSKVLALPLRQRKPRRIFVNSMSDLFHEKLTNEQIAAVFGVMAACPQHTFQVLTKRAKRMREWFEWAEREGDGFDQFRFAPSGLLTCAWEFLAGDSVGEDANLPEKWQLESIPTAELFGKTWPLPNVWLGVSVENQEAADERIPELLRTPAAVRFLSCEPLLGDLNIRHGLGGAACLDAFDGTDRLVVPTSLDWIIAGCESGPGARPCSVEWLRSLRDQCASAGVAFFLKQANESDMGKCGDADNPNGDDPCGRPVRYFVHGPKDSSVSCGCTVEGSEDANGCPPVGFGEASKRKPGGVIELPYLDGVQHAAFPESP